MPAVEGNSNKAKALAFISTISINPSSMEIGPAQSYYPNFKVRSTLVRPMHKGLSWFLHLELSDNFFLYHNL